MTLSGDRFHSLRSRLEGAELPVRFFFRDDDVGWRDDALWPLLDLFEVRRLPLDLAVIPALLSGNLVDELSGRCMRSEKRLRVHQHGWRHENHERSGRKCEFGPSRALADQREDLRMGRLELSAAFGGYSDPIFTPPWNRCEQITVDICEEVGYRALSRNAGAKPLRLGGLAEIPVSIDWQTFALDGNGAMGTEVDWTADGIQVGIMLHHAVMTTDCQSALAAFLDLLAGHDNAVCCSMMDCLPEGRSIPN